MTVTIGQRAKTDDDDAPEDVFAAVESKDDADAAESEEVDESPVDVERTSPRRRRRAVTGAVVTVFVALVAASGFLGWKLWQTQQIAQVGQQAQAVAVGYAQVLTSIDSGKVDENFNQVLDGATGEFKDMYSQSSMQLRQLLIDNKASAHGVVVESAVQSATKDKVVVLLFVDQSVSNTSVPDPRIDRSRIKMTLENVDGQWRTSKVELP